MFGIYTVFIPLCVPSTILSVGSGILFGLGVGM